MTHHISEDEAAFAREFPRAHAALGYAGRGWRVLPVHWINDFNRCTCLPHGHDTCASAGKHPLDNGWPDNATTDPQEIIEIWGRDPEANIGVATGIPSGFFVIDVDEGVRQDGTYKQGLESLIDLQDEYEELPETRAHRTGGGGTQYLFAMPDGYTVKSLSKNTGNEPALGTEYPDIDVKGDGGMVVVPPSVSGRGPYAVEQDGEVTDPPQWLLDLLLQRGVMEPLEGPEDPDPSTAASSTAVQQTPTPGWLARSVEDKIAEVRDAPDGMGNITINRIAYMIGQYVPHGWIAFDDAEHRLREAVASWRFPHPKAAYTIRRALTDGSKDPYQITGSRSTGTGPARFFGQGGIQARTLAEDILSEYPAALTPEERVALYQDGVYRRNSLALTSAVEERLEERFREAHVSTAEEVIKAKLYRAGLWLPDRTTEPLLNVLNGMLDLRTGELYDHDPGHLSSAQLPVEWIPQAACPAYVQWLEDLCPEQMDDLEESVSVMLDSSRSPLKHLFLFGPPSSGKSTFIRIAEAIAGAENRSAVTLVQIMGNRFMTANIYGKILNAAADISSGHLEDIALFKQLTGDDAFTADRKHGRTFEFHSRALFLFSANELPSVGENSEAYVKRIKPFSFAKSFKDREKPEIEETIMTELPGILARWVRAWQRREARGVYAQTAPAVQKEFENRSDRVRQWVSETSKVLEQAYPGPGSSCGQNCPAGSFGRCRVHGTARTVLYADFLSWAKESGGAKLGRNKFYDRLTCIDGVGEARIGESRIRGYNIIRKSEEE